MLILINGTLIDGTGKSPLEQATVVIEGNIIKGVGRETDYPRESNIIDLAGRLIMPGLIDCHLHIGGFVIDKPGRSIGKVSFMDMFPFMWDYLRSFAKRRRLAIENGVTTIRSAGDNYPHVIKLRDRIRSGKLSGPRIFAPGPIFTAPGGHPAGTIYKRNRYIVEHATRQVDDTETAREEVRKLAEGGVDCIKAIYSDQNPMEPATPVPKLNIKVLEAISDETHRHGLRLMVHTGNANDTRDAVKAGTDSIEHGILPGTDPLEFPDDIVTMMRENSTYYVPTLAIAGANRKVFPELFDVLKKTVKKLHDGGVRIAAGTDSGTPGVVIGKSIHIEIHLMVEAGLSPMEAICTATRNAAGNLGQEHRLGTIEEGKLADIIVVSDNPLEHSGRMGKIDVLIRNGNVLFNHLNDSPFPRA